MTLLYHHVDRRLQDPLAVSEEAFEAQLGHLRRESISVLTLAEVLRIASGELLPPDRGVFLTFDDGYADNLEAALPRLREQGMEATLFVPTAFVGAWNAWNTRVSYRARHLNWHELERWLGDGGRIGGHTHAHESAVEVGQPEFRASVELNRRLLEQRLGVEAIAFAYPYGIATRHARAEVARQYKLAWVVQHGTWEPKRDRFLLNRYFVDPRLGLRDFGHGLEALFDRLATGKAHLRGSRDVRRVQVSARRQVDREEPRGPRVALVAGLAGDSYGCPAGLRLSDLLDHGWDAHLLHGGNASTHRGLDRLPDPVLRKRVHPPPLSLRRLRPRGGLMSGAFLSLLRHPLRASAELARPADRGVRYLRAVLLALRPDVIHVLSRSERSAWVGLAELLGSRLVREEGPELRPVADRSLFEWHAPSGTPPLHVLAIGPLVWEQGFEHLLHALRLSADRGVSCECRILGSGKFEAALSFARSQLDLGDAVELFVPEVDVFAPGGRPELLEHLKWADVVVNPAVVPTFPPWLVDAQAAARPVVTTELPPGREEPALIVPHRDAEALAGALTQLAHESDLRLELGERGRDRATGFPDSTAHLAAFRELYRSLLDARAPEGPR